MNKCITLLSIAIFGMVSFVSCNKNTSVPGYSMKASLITYTDSTTNSEAYNNGNCQAVIVGTTMVVQGLSSNSTFPNYPYIELVFPYWSGVLGRYWLDSAATSYHARYWVDAVHLRTSSYGNIIINSASDRIISGSFNFTTLDSLTVSDGTFVARVSR